MSQLSAEILAKMTHDQLVEVARHMVSPARCGGLTYVDGKPMYRAGGKLWTPEEFASFSKSPAEAEGG